jgi:hypothetical protein
LLSCAKRRSESVAPQAFADGRLRTAVEVSYRMTVTFRRR